MMKLSLASILAFDGSSFVYDNITCLKPPTGGGGRFGSSSNRIYCIARHGVKVDMFWCDGRELLHTGA
jgi:hypothetical protein